MPLVGFIDPSHDERKRSTNGRRPLWLPVEDVLGLALSEGPMWSPWSYELIQAVVAHHQERDYLSTSAITGGCMRGTVLERCEDYVESLDGRYASIRGTLVHRTMELAARPGSMPEWRFWTDVFGTEFSCSPDLIVPNDGLLVDYKTTENPPDYYPYTHHSEQVQLNRWVVNNAKRWEKPDSAPDVDVQPAFIDFKKLAVVYLGPKKPLTMLVTKSIDVRNTSGKGTHREKRPYVWSDKEVLGYLEPRLEGLAMALASYPEWPDGLEDYPGFEGPPGWQCPGPPLCWLLPTQCLAKRYPTGLVW